MRQLTFLFSAGIILCLIQTPVFGHNQTSVKKQESTSVGGKTGSKEGAGTTGTYLYQKKEEYQKKAEEKLNRLEANVKQLYLRAEKKGERAREKITRAADNLRKKSESAKNKLKDLKESGEEKWDIARDELDSMLKDLERTYNRTASKFKD
ncbi:MAG: hypothetical protein HZA15_04225 [Nitrospirae bacterium]|nr:hypothetical protein [Nitrospirota bacterium]